jgi:N-acyl-L-homoserine lactone synthetase
VAHTDLPQAANSTSRQRVFKKDLRWYFRTHCDNERGPFIDKQQAYWALAKHIKQKTSRR